MSDRVATLKNELNRDRTLMIVDDEPSVRRMLQLVLDRNGYECHVEVSATAVLDALPAVRPAVVISDINMPDHDGIWLLRKIIDLAENTAVIMLTGYAEVDTAVGCLRDGASDFLTKPVRNGHLLTAVERALDRRRLIIENRIHQLTLEERVREATEELRQAYQEIADTYDDTLRTLCSALDAREEETGDHSRRVAALALAIAEELGMSRSEKEHLERAALLHDIGKIGVPDHILLKPGPLDREEWEIMQRHPSIGYQILENIPFLSTAAEIVLSHHERFDGRGYPRGLLGAAIPIGARIFSVADTVDAITSDRPYRKAAPMRHAIDEIRRCAGSHFDPEVANALLRIGADRIAAIHRRSVPGEKRPGPPADWIPSISSSIRD